ncbi:hypothetical protein BGX34_003236 [Mortierella sp. NVP85]|nr:hypothetical protein BGX34_003236 [Mortierella sp. NVP85]
MVTITPACAATDGVSIYIISVDASKVLYSSDTFYVLVKSNPNPNANLKDLSWTVVSKIQMNKSLQAIMKGGPNDYSCAVDSSTKVFTIVARRVHSGLGAVDEYVGGVQFNPDGNGGAGAWTNIKSSPGYQWSVLGYAVEQLYNFKSSTSSSGTLLHAFYSSIAATHEVYVASMDAATSTMKQNPAAWTLDKTKHGDLNALTFANGNLYTLGYTAGPYPLTYGHLNEVPIPADPQTPPQLSSVATYNATIIMQSCHHYLNNVWLRAVGDNVAIICRPESGGMTTKVYLFDGKAKTFKDVKLTNGATTTPISMVAMPGGASSPPFVFISSDTGLFSIPLGDPNEGTWLGASKIDIPESTFTSGTGGPGGPGGTDGGSSQHPIDSDAGILNPNTDSKKTIVIATVSVLGVLFFSVLLYIFFRRRRAARIARAKQPTTVYYAANTAAESPAPPAPPTPPAPPAPAPAVPSNVPEAPVDSEMKIEDTTFIHPGQVSKIEDITLNHYGQVPSYPYPPHDGGVSPYQSPVTFAETPMSPWQSQEPSFSTHPRPNVVVTGADEKEPQGFVPPPPTAAPRGPAVLSQTGAPQAVQQTSAPQVYPAVSAPQAVQQTNAPQVYPAVSAPQTVQVQAGVPQSPPMAGQLPSPQMVYYQQSLSPVPPPATLSTQAYPPPPPPRSGPSAPQYRD